MTIEEESANRPVESLSLLTRLIGPTQLLPEESREAYNLELQQLLDELGTSSPLAIMLAEQLYEAVVWSRRHGADKARVVINQMAVELARNYGERNQVRALLYAHISGDIDDEENEELEDRLVESGHTLSSLRAAATAKCIDSLKKVDDLIARQLSTVRQLQKSLEALALKPLLVRRLELQIEDLQRDLAAIEHDNS